MSYDKTLKVGPYNFGFSTTRPDWVEHYPYQNGLLVWQWDTSQTDNNTSVHPGQGLILPVDAHAKPLKWADGTLLRNKIQAVRRPVQLRTRPTASRCTTRTCALKIKPHAGDPVFDDRKGTYYVQRRTRPAVSRSLTPTPRSRS